MLVRFCVGSRQVLLAYWRGSKLLLLGSCMGSDLVRKRLKIGWTSIGSWSEAVRNFRNWLVLVWKLVGLVVTCSVPLWLSVRLHVVIDAPQR